MKKNHALRALVSLLLACVFCLGAFGCAETGTPAETDPTPAAPVLVLVDNGNALAPIVRRDEADGKDADVLVAVRLRKAIAGYASEATATMGTDWNMGKEDDKPEILVGDVNCPASLQAREGLEYGEYVVQLVGNKLVVAGTPLKALQTAEEVLEDLILRYSAKDEAGQSRIAIPASELNIRAFADLDFLYGLVVSDSCIGYTSPETSAETVEVDLNKYDTLEVKGEPEDAWFSAAVEDETLYFSSKDVRGFENLSELKAFAAVVWARDIAADNEFHYGDNAWSHHHGCYFCGTNGMNNAKVKAGAKYEDQLKSYCCNPFVTAAYCHGAGAVKQGTDVTLAVNCKNKKINLANDSNEALNNTKYFVLITKPRSINDLKPGDILLTATHAVIVSENGKLVEASGGDDNVKNSDRWNNSIRERAISDSFWSTVTKIYRYIGE